METDGLDMLWVNHLETLVKRDSDQMPVRRDQKNFFLALSLSDQRASQLDSVE